MRQWLQRRNRLQMEFKPSAILNFNQHFLRRRRLKML
jgi:hypothetical protein